MLASMSGEKSKRDQLLDEARGMLSLARRMQPTMPTPEKKKQLAGIVAILEEIELIIQNADNDDEIDMAAQSLGVALERMGLANYE